MRRISAPMNKRLHQRVQTDSTGAAPSTDLWISRPTTALTQAQFLERQTVTANSSSDLSIAVCHPRFGASNSQIYLAYIQDGVARVTTSRTFVRMSAHTWFDAGFEEPAQAVAIAFDGRMPKNRAGQIEFITEDKPWVFWVNAGALHARKLGSEATVTLAESGCTDVSAIRAMWSEVGSFDFGLCVFFILAGTIYYRQIIGGEWMDAAPVAFGPEGVTWTEIAAQRTWDYRVALQAKSSDGTIYELFTQFMGIGKQGVEHLDIEARADLDLIHVDIQTPGVEEHAVQIASASAGAPYGGLYSALPPKIISAYNIDDGNGDWGKVLVMVFDAHLRADEIAANAAAFRITDSTGRVFSAASAELHEEDAMTVTLAFGDFNAAVGECVAAYTPGTAITLADTPMEHTELAFTPVNLVPPNIPVPEVEEIWALDTNGTQLAMRFSHPLIGDLAGNEVAFTVTTQEYDMVPGGTLQEKARAGTGVQMDEQDDHILILELGTGNTTSIQNAIGEVTVDYAGGTLMGEGGMVPNFSRTFRPEGLAYEGHQHDIERIDVDISARSELIRVYHHDRNGPEHISVSASATSALIHVDDL